MLNQCTIPLFGDSRLPTRFWAKVYADPSGCWRWTACQNRQGYGRFRLYGVTQNAHRILYRELVDRQLGGLQIDHLCREPSCVNPAHLEAVTPLVNTQRGAGNGSQTHCPQGHPYSLTNTYIHYRGGRWSGFRRHCRTCNRECQRRFQARRRSS